MKKLLVFLVCLVFVAFCFVAPVYAEGEELEPEAETETPPETVAELEPTEEDLKEEISEWLSNFMEESMVAKIIGWAVDAGVLSALFVVYLKYRKYKDTTIKDLIDMTKKEIGKYLKEAFDDLSVDQIDKIKKAIDELEKSNETIMKVLVLMQDSTANGKVALLDYLGSKTESKEIKETATEVVNEIEKVEAVKEEVKAKVAGDYEEIF